MIKRCTHSIIYNLTVLLKSLGGHATKNATGPVPQELHPHESALASEAQYRPPVSTSAFNSLLTRNRTVLPDPGYQRDLEGLPDPEGAGKLQTSQGSRHSEVGTEEDAEKKQRKKNDVSW